MCRLELAPAGDNVGLSDEEKPQDGRVKLGAPTVVPVVSIFVKTVCVALQNPSSETISRFSNTGLTIGTVGIGPTFWRHGAVIRDVQYCVA